MNVPLIKYMTFTFINYIGGADGYEKRKKTYKNPFVCKTKVKISKMVCQTSCAQFKNLDGEDMIYVNIEDGLKFEDLIEMSNWDLEDLGEDFFKLIGGDGESHLIEYHQNDDYYRILSDIELDLFVSG